MGKVLIINRFYEIKQGLTHGFQGKLIAYDAMEVEVNLTINTNSENLELVESEEQ